MKKAILILLLLAALTFLPQLASVGVGKKVVLAYLEKRYNVQIQVDTLSLSWRGKQQASGLRWTDPSSKAEYTAEKIEFSATLFDPFHPSSAKIKGGKISLFNQGGIFETLITQGKNLDLYFPLLELSIEKQTLNFQKTEVLLNNSLPFFTWGQVDLSDRQLNLRIGLPAISLKKLFGIKELPIDFILEVPLKGNIDKLSLKKITSKVFKHILKENKM